MVLSGVVILSKEKSDFRGNGPMAAAAAAAATTPWWSPGKNEGQATKINMDSPTSVLFVDKVEAQDQTLKCIVDDDDWDPELATGSSPKEFCGAEVLDDVMRRKLFKVVECIDEIIPWDVLIAEPVLKAEAAPLQDIESRQVPSLIFELIVGRRRRSIVRDDACLDGMVVGELDIGKIKKRRRAKRGDGTKRHGRPPDRRPFGHSESWNMGVYPGRGPALISRADMIILPPTTPSAITFKDSTTLAVGVSGHSAAGETVTGTFLFVLAVNPTPGPVTSTSTRDETSKPPFPRAPKPF